MMVPAPAPGPGSTAGEPGRAVLAVPGGPTIPLDELSWRFTGSGGPGGQHANTSNTRVELLFDIAASPNLTPRQRELIMEKLGPEVRVVAADERSQARNRALALERLRQRLIEGLHRDPPRTASRPSRAAKRRRVEQKRRRSELKRTRRPPQTD